MVDTIKFSQFIDGGDLEPDQTFVGLEGTNAKFTTFPLLPPGTTGDRPAPAANIYYRLRFNTTLESYEYYSPVLSQWIQLQDSIDVQDFPFVIYTDEPLLPSAFNLGSLSSGILKQTVVTGVATPAIALVDTDYYGPGMVGYMQQPAGVKDVNNNIICEFKWDAADATEWLQFFNGKPGDPASIAVDGLLPDVQLDFYSKGVGQIAFNSAAPNNQYSFFSGTSYQHQTVFNMPSTAVTRTATWQDSDGTIAWLSDVMNTVQSLQGTANQVLVNGTTGSPQVGNIILTTPQNINTNSDVVFNSLQLTQALDSSFGGTGVNNAGHLLEYNGDMTWIGAFTFQATLTGNTSVQFPTTGLLATTADASGHVNAGTLGQLAYYASAGDTVSGTNAGTGVLTALGINIGSAGAFVVNGGALGTPASGTLTNCLGLPIGGLTGLGTGVASALAAAVSGSGGIALTTSPIFTTPTLGVAAATSINFGGSALNTYAQSTSWTPTITFDTPGNLSVSYSTQTGVYSRIGNIVSLHFVLSCTPTFTTSSGLLRIVLPITPASNSIGNLQFQASAFPASTTSLFLQSVSGNTGMVIGANGSSIASNYISVTQATSGNALNITGSITYLA